MFLPPWRLCFGTKPYWVSGLCKSLLLGTRTEEQDVGPKATAIMSGVFIVFVFYNNLQANTEFYRWAKKKLKKSEGSIREPQWRFRNFAASLKNKARRPSTTKASPVRNENNSHSKRSHHSITKKASSIQNKSIINSQRKQHSFRAKTRIIQKFIH